MRTFGDGLETSSRIDSQNSREVVVSRECLTTVRVSHDIRETFARVSHNVHANFNQFYLVANKSRNSLFMSHLYAICIFVALCISRKLNCDVFANVCEGLATGSRHM